MSEYIKTVAEIASQFDKDARYIAKNRMHLEELGKQKWVSLELVKQLAFDNLSLKDYHIYLSLLDSEEKKQ